MQGKKKPKQETPEQQTVKQEISPLDEEIMKAVQNKASKPGFEVNIRILFSAEKKERTKELLSHSAGSFEQLSSPNLNSFKMKEAEGKQLKIVSLEY